MEKFKSLLYHSILILLALIMIFPIFWMLLYSLKEFPEKYAGFWDLLSAPITLINYTEAFQSDSFNIYFINSIFVASVITISNLLFCTMVGYAFARKTFTGKKILFASILGVMVIPPQVIMIPLFRLMVTFDWINTYYALIVPWLVTPFGIFLTKQYIETIPTEIEDAARIDGANQSYIIFRIVMPLCKPILAVLGIYIFLANWNTFLYPFLFTNNENFRTLPVGLTFYLGKQSIDWGHLMAGAGISAIPVLILFLIFQKQIIKSLTSGALKE